MAVLYFKNENGEFVEVPTIRGRSAYQVAVDNGFDGTEAEWLETLKGPIGPMGPHGKDGTYKCVEVMTVTRNTLTDDMIGKFLVVQNVTDFSFVKGIGALGDELIIFNSSTKSLEVHSGSAAFASPDLGTVQANLTFNIPSMQCCSMKQFADSRWVVVHGNVGRIGLESEGS